MGRIYPNIYISGINVGGQTPESAINLISQSDYLNRGLNIISQEEKLNLKPSQIGLNYDIKGSVTRAYNLPRSENFISDSLQRVLLIYNKKNLALYIKYNHTELNAIVNKIAQDSSFNPVYPGLELINNQVNINKGSAGRIVNTESLKADIVLSLSLLTNMDIIVPTTSVDPSLNNFQADKAKARAESYLGKSLTLKYDLYNDVYPDSQILKIIDLPQGYKQEEVNKILFKTAKDINRDPQNPKFEFTGNKVTEFSPALPGIAVDNDKFKSGLIDSLNNLATTQEKNLVYQIPVSTTDPLVKTGDVNNLGIKELIGRGTSTYFHSIPGRVFNVNLAASRVNGTLVAPGETFSFDQTIGDISRATGYQQAYVISGGKTILGDGGGVCQVSTTLFRAVLNAGLPVNERSAHAYRVGYYEQNSPPGIDATVYYPTVDFKFTNDTGHHVLIEAKNDPKNYSLIFEIYGTNDGRVATISKPVVSNYSPPLPTLYQDDPTLAVGITKQVDYAAAGSRVTFNYSVTKDGQQIFHKTFVSNYQPWAAAYLRGTKI